MISMYPAKKTKQDERIGINESSSINEACWDMSSIYSTVQNVIVPKHFTAMM